MVSSDCRRQSPRFQAETTSATLNLIVSARRSYPNFASYEALPSLHKIERLMRATPCARGRGGAGCQETNGQASSTPAAISARPTIFGRPPQPERIADFPNVWTAD